MKYSLFCRHLLAAAGMFVLLGNASAAAQNRLYSNEFPLSAVTLGESPFKKARDLNIEVLLSYDVDRLLAPYLKEAGLKPKAESFANWDGLDGHVGGHYLTALAIHTAATGDPRLKQRLDYMLDELERAMKASPEGILSGVPGGSALWADIRGGDVEAVNKYWVPWYNIHKIYAGLRDAWVYTGSERARDMFVAMADWCERLVAPLPADRMEKMLDTEFGGMNEVLADAYAITGERRYLDAACKFSHRRLLDSMAAGVDNLDNMHANTQVPKAVGYQRVAELGGGDTYDRAAHFFWDTVTGERSLAFGGNSRREHFPSADDCKSYIEEREGPETCNTNNMLKLTEGLFRMNPDARYADFYERALFNHILSSQHPGHGGYVYFTPARPAHYRVYSSPNSAMWCCVGTGMENHGKYGQFIYTRGGDNELYVNLFIPSALDWREKGVRVEQSTDFPAEGRTALVMKMKKPTRFTLRVRRPGWATGEFAYSINGKRIAADSDPSSHYVTIDRKWRDGDRLELAMDMPVRVEELIHNPQYVAVMRGPILLGARMGTEHLDGLVADDSRWGHIASGPLVSIFDTPQLIGSRDDIVGRLQDMKPVEGRPGCYTVPGLFTGRYEGLVLEPFAGIHDCRYITYFLTMTPEEFEARQAEARRTEEARLALDRRTVDAVNTGEQQPEVDHGMKESNSRKGNHAGEAWRDAVGGFFAYRMATGGRDDLSLMVRYWGNESGNRAFDILVDGTSIASENIVSRWGRDEFVDVTYAIPARLLQGRDDVEIRFESAPGATAGGVYHIRLVKPE